MNKAENTEHWDLEWTHFTLDRYNSMAPSRRYEILKYAKIYFLVLQPIFHKSFLVWKENEGFWSRWCHKKCST